jgi:hypothetical protein
VSFIDVSDILLDPDIAGQTFTVIRRREQINSSGQGVPAQPPEIITSVYGQITPVGENSLLREVAFQTQMQTIQVITQFRLRGATAEPSTGQQFQPDLISWRGNYYIVNTLNEFAQYGNGFIVAECIEVDYQDVPTQINQRGTGKLDFSKPQNSGLV